MSFKNFADIEDYLPVVDFRRWYKVWGWGAGDEEEDRLFGGRKNSRISKMTHRPKRGRSAGNRGR